MRTRELEAGGYYHALVTPHIFVPIAAADGEVRADWDSDGDVWVAGDGTTADRLETTDRPVRMRYSRTRPKQGVLGDFYEFDAAGRRYGDPVSRTILRPSEIRSEWATYADNRGDWVKKMAENFADARTKQRRREKLQADLEAFHPGATVETWRGDHVLRLPFDSMAALRRYIRDDAGASA